MNGETPRLTDSEAKHGIARVKAELARIAWLPFPSYWGHHVTRIAGLRFYQSET